MRVAAAVLLFAVVCLTASSLAWLRATGAPAAVANGADAAAVLTAFQSSTRADGDVDISARYGARPDLLDPRLALPAWHKHPREEARAVHAATKQCPPAAVADLRDAALAKVHRWHAKTCALDALPPDEQVDRAPFVHPSGRSYAALALPRITTQRSSWIRDHARSFHVLELAALDPATLDADDRVLAAVPPRAWESLTRGDGLVLTAHTLVVADHGPLGLARLRVYSRDAWESFTRDGAVALVPRAPSALCARPASSELCWEARSPADRHRSALLFGTTASAALVAFASVALGLAFVGERRRLHADRIHVLRTLTHELRTPATSLRLDIEPLRSAYDELPASCQEPLLRLSDGVERLHRVLHRSARYMALFETNATAEQLAKIREVPSAREMFEELSEEWPEGVSLTSPSKDGPLRTDPEWLGVAVRNLVENGTRHGTAPVTVAWMLENGTLTVRVSDAGSTPKLSLRRAVRPYQRDVQSPGLGLGLAIVDRVARLLGGRLSHEPSPTTFELRIPAERSTS